MILNRDAGELRPSSHTGLRPTRRPAQSAGGVDAAGRLRVNPAVAAATPRQMVMFGGLRAAESLGMERGSACATAGGRHA